MAHRDVRKLILRYGLDSTVFRPTLGALLRALETNPKQFPKKRGKLDFVRAAEVRFRGGVWRAVFYLDESARIVFVQALGPHDIAYADAKRRL